MYSREESFPVRSLFKEDGRVIALSKLLGSPENILYSRVPMIPGKRKPFLILCLSLQFSLQTGPPSDLFKQRFDLLQFEKGVHQKQGPHLQRLDSRSIRTLSGHNNHGISGFSP